MRNTILSLVCLCSLGAVTVNDVGIPSDAKVGSYFVCQKCKGYGCTNCKFGGGYEVIPCKYCGGSGCAKCNCLGRQYTPAKPRLAQANKAPTVTTSSDIQVSTFVPAVPTKLTPDLFKLVP